jgi:WD40 repeat protein
VGTLLGNADGITSCAYSHDGARIVTAGWDGAVTVWQADTGTALMTLPHPGIVTSATFSADDTLVIAGDVTGSVHLWDLASRAEVARVEGHAEAVEHCAASDDGTLLLSAGDDHTLKLWGVQAALAEGVGDHPRRATHFAALVPDRRQVLAATDELIGLFEVDEALRGPPVRGVPWESGGPLAYGCDGTRLTLAAAGQDGCLRIYSVDSRGVRELAGQHGWLTATGLSADGRRAVGGGRDGSVTVWDVASAEVITIIEGHDERVSCCALSADGGHLASGSWDESLRVWDVASGRRVTAFTGHEDRVNDCVFSPDAARVLSVSDDRTARLWDAATGTSIAVLSGHAGSVTCCCLSADGRLAATGGEDQSVIVWDLASATERARFVGVGPITSCDVDATGRALCCTDRAGRLYLLDLFGV